MIACLMVVGVVIVFETRGSRLYMKAQAALLSFLLLSGVVFMLRLRVGIGQMLGIFRGSTAIREYWQSGLLGMDAFFLTATLFMVFVVDHSFWSTTTIRVGTVLSAVGGRAVVGAIRARRAGAGA